MNTVCPFSWFFFKLLFYSNKQYLKYSSSGFLPFFIFYFPPRPGERSNCPPFPRHRLPPSLVPRGTPPLLPAGPLVPHLSSHSLLGPPAAAADSQTAAQKLMASSCARNRAVLGSGSGCATSSLPLKHLMCFQPRKQIHLLPLFLTLRICISLMRFGLGGRCPLAVFAPANMDRGVREAVVVPAKSVFHIAWYD